MFQSARLKLTVWYLLMIMVVSGLFSIAFYDISTREIQRVIDRIEFEESMRDDLVHIFRPPNFPTIQELQRLKHRAQTRLILINGIILVFAGAASYFLAGKTLKPIQHMVDEQTQFISNASHELRTPLATLRAEMEGSLLEKNLTDKQARALIKSNLEELTTLQDLTNNLLTLAQVHNSSDAEQMENISLRQVLQSAVKKVNTLARKKHISITTTKTDFQAFGNSSNLTTMIVIFLENAIKYSPANTTVEVKMKQTGKHIFVSVKDQGIGISQDELPYIFNRFYRADKSRSQAEGYGLGLSIARQIAEAHGSTVTVKSAVGKGTTFIVGLPRVL